MVNTVNANAATNGSNIVCGIVIRMGAIVDVIAGINAMRGAIGMFNVVDVFGVMISNVMGNWHWRH